MGDRPAAAHYYRLNLERLDTDGHQAGSDTVDALLFIAEYKKVGGGQSCFWGGRQLLGGRGFRDRWVAVFRLPAT